MSSKLFVLLFSLLALSISAQKPKGDRVLAWQVDVAENGNYADSAWPYATCVEAAHLLVSWNSIEKTANTFDYTYINEILGAMNFFYPAVGTKVELQFAPVHIGKAVPSDLQNVAFDNPQMISRGKSILDTLFRYIPNVKLQALSIGNELDAVFGINSTAYAQYKVFLDSMVPYAKQLYQNLHGETLKVGVTCTHHGLTSPATSSLCKTLYINLDYILTTYYPLNNDFTMKDPTVVYGDFKELVDEYNGWTQPIYLAECGYSTSAMCNSSEQKQADFYKEVFKAWDSLSNRIEAITIFKTTDWSSAVAEQYRIDYKLDNDTFIEYLRTLGVRTWAGNGSNKIAWEQINCELKNRNWCTTAACKLNSIPERYSSRGIKWRSSGDYLIPLSASQNSLIRLIDLNGRIIKKSENKLFTQDVPSGIYILQIQEQNELIYSQKIYLN